MLLTVVGVLVSDNVYRRLHFLAPAATVGVVAVAAAIVIAEGARTRPASRQSSPARILFVMNPILTHATARAARAHGARTVGPNELDSRPDSADGRGAAGSRSC